MGLLGGINVRFSADLSKLSQGFSEATRLIGSFGGGVAGPMGMAGAAIAGVGLAAVGLAASSVQAAGDFQSSMLKVQAYAGLSGQAAKDLQSKILAMSSAVGVGPKELADALYPIISSGYNASQAIDILNLSAQTAAASGAKTAVVADGLTTSLKAMGAPASDATKYMDIMNKTVAQGKTEFPQYAAVIGKASLSAKSAGIPFLDMNAALATLTTHGFPSVAQASTAMSNMFNQMGPKVDAMAQHAKQLGLAFDEQAFKGMSLSDKIAYLNKVTGGNQGEILKLLGGSTLALKAFNALSGSTDDYKKNLTALQGAQGTTGQVFATASQGYEFHMKQLSAAFDTVKITLGNALLPILTKVLSALTPLITQFANWISGLESGKSTVSGFSGLIKWLGDFATNNLLPIWNTLQETFQKQVIPAFKEMWTNIQPLLPTLGTLAMFIGSILSNNIQTTIKYFGALSQIFAGTITTISGLLAFFTDLFTGKFGNLGKDLEAIGKGVIQVIMGLVNGIMAPFQQMYDTMIGNAQKAKIQLDMQHNQMKINTINHAEDQAKKVIAASDNQRKGIIQKLLETKDPAERAQLEMQLKAVDAKELEAKKVLDAEEKKKQDLIKKQKELQAQLDEANKTLVQKAMDAMGQWWTGAVNWMGKIKDSVVNKFNETKDWILNFFPSLQKGWNNGWNGLVNTATNIFNGLKNGVRTAFNGVIDSINGAINAINGVSSKIGVPGIPLIPHLAKGTQNFGGGLALVGENGPEYVMLPRGSQVYPNGTTPNFGGSAPANQSSASAASAGDIHVHVEFDGDEIAHMVGNSQTGIMRLKAGRRYI